jgi:hypothetical protein
VSAAAGLAVLLMPAGTARAADTISIAPAAPLVEDVSGGLATTFRLDSPGVYDLEWHVHDDPRLPCAPTPAADDGRLVRGRSLEPLKAGGDTWTIFTMFADPGRYLVCVWATPSAGGDAILGQAAVTVGEPVEKLSLTAPATVAAGRPLRVRAVARSQAWRMAFVTVNAGDVPCASSYIADRSLAEPVVGLVRSRFSESSTALLRTPGTYRLCGWLQETARDPAPELRAQRVIRVIGRRGAPRTTRDFDSR